MTTPDRDGAQGEASERAMEAARGFFKRHICEPDRAAEEVREFATMLDAFSAPPVREVIDTIDLTPQDEAFLAAREAAGRDAPKNPTMLPAALIAPPPASPAGACGFSRGGWGCTLAKGHDGSHSFYEPAPSPEGAVLPQEIEDAISRYRRDAFNAGRVDFQGVDSAGTEADALLRAAILAHVARAVREEREGCARVAESEPELPGEIPAAMVSAVYAAPESVLRGCVVTTKRNIASRIRTTRTEAEAGAKCPVCQSPERDERWCGDCEPRDPHPVDSRVLDCVACRHPWHDAPPAERGEKGGA